MTTVAERSKEQVHHAPVVRHGEAITVPELMPLKEAAKLILQQAEQEEAKVNLMEDFPYAVWDVAHAFPKVLEEFYGVAISKGTPGWFGVEPPSKISIFTDYEVKENIIWGQFTWPQSENATFSFEAMPNGQYGMPTMRVWATAKNKYEGQFKKIMARLQEYLKQHSIYRGKAIKIDFDSGEAPQFLDLKSFDPTKLVYPAEVEKMLEANIHTRIMYPELCKLSGVPTKRGVLLEGPYGTGKTAQAFAAAILAVANGWTLLYLADVSQLPKAIMFSKMYGRTVIYAEDIDRILDGERDEEMDEVFNTVDGIDTKNAEIVLIVTTNHLEKINKAMLRPGRLDVTIHIGPPDAEAVTRLISGYALDTLAEGVTGADAGMLLAGQIPAVVREAVERAKLYAIRRTKGQPFHLTDEDLSDAATEVVKQVKATSEPQVLKIGAGEAFVTELDERIGTHVKRVLAPVLKYAEAKGYRSQE